jgi:hypothetical protein
MPGSEPPRRRRVRLESIAFGIGIVAFVVIGYWNMPADAPPPDFPEIESVADAPDGSPSEQSRMSTTSTEAPLPPTGSLHLVHSDIAGDAPFVVHLGLPEPSRDEQPRPVRLISQPDHRILELDGRLSDDRSAAAIEIDPAYLAPGEYLVEVETTERSHFPLRRYAIVVSE